AMITPGAGHSVHWTDDGIAIGCPDDEPPGTAQILLDPDEIHDRVVEQLTHSAMFAAFFRENAARALLLPRRRPKGRTPLWLQRRKSSALMGVALRYPRFPITLETYRECLNDVFDMPALTELLSAIRRGEVNVVEVQTPTPSPFARSLVFQFTAAHLYDTDTPLAEKRMAALTLDRSLLKELLGETSLVDLLDTEAIENLESDLQRLSEDRLAQHADGLHDLLRRLGDLSGKAIKSRTVGDYKTWLTTLQEEYRVVAITMAGEGRYIAIEDASIYRDALDVELPNGLPPTFLEPVEAPLESLLLRWARTHSPFHSSKAAQQFGLPTAIVTHCFRALEEHGKVLQDTFTGPQAAADPEWCDPEVLRRLRRTSLAKLREEVSPAKPDVLGRYLPAWHGVGTKRGGMGRLEEVLDQLEGTKLPFSALESHILPARVPDYQPLMLDQMGAMGKVVWIGCGTLGPNDGKIALYRRESVSALAPEPARLVTALDKVGPIHEKLLEHLESRGASFLVELQMAVNDKDILPALWDLVWAGLVTNDTFVPLRGLNSKKGRTKDRIFRMAGGRWSAVRHLHTTIPLLSPGPPDSTTAALAKANSLLQRYGVVSREVVLHEGIEGGFAALYPVFRAMEEGGRLQRGYFVDGLGGAQFALPGAIDRLRSHSKPTNSACVLAATDPANVWGSLFSWPEPAAEASPRRVSGARVVLVGGRPILFLDKGAHSLVSFPSTEADRVRAIKALQSMTGFRVLRLKRIDGVPAPSSTLAPVLVQQGFAEDYLSLVFSR
ncbi:MAG: DEAD/DEAH box helicase, partial [Proteobacteria bacterium]|nr:DEAD/DEAH box helicase [Pseudomonadota bacterium]